MTPATIKRIRRLSLAREAFADAREGARTAGLSDPENNKELYQVIVTGVVISYARPFLANSGVGMLGDAPADMVFADFDDTILGKTHEYLLEHRRRIFGHSDYTFAKENPTPTSDGHEALEVFVEFINGEPSIFLQSQTLRSDWMKRIQMLCDFQIDRITNELKSLILGIAGDLNNYSAGVQYKVDEDFSCQ